MNQTVKHPGTGETVEEVLVGQLRPDNEFFMFGDIRYTMYEQGAKCTSVGDTPPQNFRIFDPKEKALRIIKKA